MNKSVYKCGQCKNFEIVEMAMDQYRICGLCIITGEMVYNLSSNCGDFVARRYNRCAQD